MRSQQEYSQAMTLISDGLNPSEVARLTGIPRATVREWAAGKGHRHMAGDAGTPGRPCDRACDTIAARALPFADIYAYLLGLYLGDGTISTQARGVDRMRIFLDLQYPGIVEGAAAAMTVVRGSDRIGISARDGCAEVGSSWKHWRCVFPQAGPGPKHLRDVSLAGWQQDVVDAHPDWLLQGLYESDGNRHINSITRSVGGRTKEYRYSRYMFKNESAQIRQMFTDACARVGVQWTYTAANNIAVSRREDVALLDRFLGPKR